MGQRPHQRTDLSLPETERRPPYPPCDPRDFAGGCAALALSTQVVVKQDPEGLYSILALYFLSVKKIPNSCVSAPARLRGAAAHTISCVFDFSTASLFPVAYVLYWDNAAFMFLVAPSSVLALAINVVSSAYCTRLAALT